MRKNYTTKDVYQAGFLILRAFNYEIIRHEDKFVFAFNASNVLYQAIAEYNSGAIVEAVCFALVVKNAESQILSARNKIGLWDWD